MTDYDELIGRLRVRHADLMSRVIASDQSPTIFSEAADAIASADRRWKDCYDKHDDLVRECEDLTAWMERAANAERDARTWGLQIEIAEKALEEIACFNDKGANEHLALFGSYSLFDEPGSVQIARRALATLRSLEVDPEKWSARDP